MFLSRIRRGDLDSKLQHINWQALFYASLPSLYPQGFPQCSSPMMIPGPCLRTVDSPGAQGYSGLTTQIVTLAGKWMISLRIL